MDKLNKLPEISDRALHGLQAGPALKNRIVKAAETQASGASGTPARFRPRLLPVSLAAVAAMILCVFLLNGIIAVPSAGNDTVIHSFSAGTGSSSGLSFEAFLALDPASVTSVETGSDTLLSVPQSFASLQQALREHSSLFEGESGSLEGRLVLHCGESGEFVLPVERPLIQFEDGVRECDVFFDLLPGRPD